MRANWVLNEEEKEKFMNARRKKEPVKENKCKPKSVSYISEEEMIEVNEYIHMSEYFEMSKVKDMETELIRELIRYSHLRS